MNGTSLSLSPGDSLGRQFNVACSAQGGQSYSYIKLTRFFLPSGTKVTQRLEEKLRLSWTEQTQHSLFLRSPCSFSTLDFARAVPFPSVLLQPPNCLPPAHHYHPHSSG